MITTKSVGIGVDEANPKPVRHVNWTGQPMKEGDNYWGESGEPPQRKEGDATLSQPHTTQVGNAAPTVQPAGAAQPRHKRKRGGRSAWSAERRAEFGAKVRAMWQAKKSSAPEVKAQEQQNNQQ